MRTKLSLFLFAFVTAIGTWATATDLPVLTTDANNPKLYVVKNTRSGMYVSYRGTDQQLRQIADLSSATMWYFTEGTGTFTNDDTLSVRLRSYFADGMALASQTTNSFTNDGGNIAIAARSEGDGLNIDVWNFSYARGYQTAFNDQSTTAVTVYGADDAGSAFTITSVDDIIEDLRTSYSNKVDGCETLTALFSSSDCATAKAAITNATTGLEILQAYEALIATADSKLVTMQSHDGVRYISIVSNVTTTESANIIKVKAKHGLLAFQNYEDDTFVGLSPTSQSQQFTSSTTPEYFQLVFNDDYPGFVCLASSNARTSSGTLTMHKNGSNNIVTWYSGAANSYFQFALKTMDDYKTTIYSRLSEMSSWQPLYSSSDIATAISALDDANTKDEIDNVYQNAVKAANGKLIYVENYSNAGKYVKINASNAAIQTYPTVIKLIVNDDLSYSLQGYLDCENYYAEQLRNVNYDYVASSTTAGKYRLGHNNTKGFLFYSTEHSGCLHYSNSNIVRWYDDADASYWTVYDVADAAYLGSYYDALLPYQANYGNYGGYKYENNSKAYFDENIIGACATVLSDLTTYSSNITFAKTVAKNAYDGLTLVVPVDGDFLRIKAGVSEKYITGTPSSYYSFLSLSDTPDNTTIIYYDGAKLLNYSNGLYSAYTSAQADAGGAGDSYTFAGSANRVGYYTIYSTTSSQYMYDSGNTEGRGCVDRQGSLGGNNTDWTLEEVTELPVNITSIDGHGYASFYTPVGISSLPSGVKAYIATLTTDRVQFSEITSIPAGTAVVLYMPTCTESTTVELPIGTASASTDGNVLRGNEATVALGEQQVLTMQSVNGDLGFYKYNGTNLAGFKAFINISDIPSSIKGFSFDFEDSADGIETIQNAETNAHMNVYDLQGRKVNANGKLPKGIYIENGKKVLK